MTTNFTPKAMPTEAEVEEAKEKRQWLPNHGYFHARIVSAEAREKDGEIIRTSKDGDQFIYVNIKLELSLPGKDQTSNAFLGLCIGLWYGLERDFLTSFNILESDYGKPETWVKKSKPSIIKRKPSLEADAYKSDGEFLGFATSYNKKGDKLYLQDEICEILPFAKILPEDKDEEINNKLYEDFFFQSKNMTADSQPGFESDGVQSTIESQNNDEKENTDEDIKNF